ncbi:penicillin-binding protein 2B [Aerococcus sp. 150760007-1]|uniref:Penicillin-binding protein n=1 Tax=Aerococcus urinaeequi TaxID=51665 RepID=A0ABR5ZWD4_9LACT|nr:MULTISPECIES: penicillin-binding protein [Lactobacillales]KAF3302549.1 PASTA domain-containing protein [Carnobacterium sp. PL17RED31]KAF3300876.1 PASTA domain-containing protein [Carnobacterium sp. PL12RED10]MBA5745922.1 penicillin-binding protein [Aerococcus urinaeequi]MBA5828707.1 penicillin-binding protein [Aerococcus urinaeequi]MBA5859610.1 penicillin-binding protein [Aerococcus urinaeequi]
MKDSKKLKKNRKKTIRAMMGLAGFLLLIFGIRLTQIMVFGTVNGQDLSEQAQNLYDRSSILSAQRGTIYDVGGNPLAMDATSYSLYAVLTDEWSEPEDPQYVVDKKNTAQVLSQYIDLTADEILERLNTQDASQVEFGTAGQDLTYAEMKAIDDQNLPGIMFNETPTRMYPNGVFASHLIGYAEYMEAGTAIDSRLTGQMGLELSMDGILKGTNGRKSYQSSSTNVELSGTGQVEEETTDGSDAYLTLDSRLQTYLETLMTEVYEKYEPTSMTVMLVEPETGEIVAASQRPTFNLETKEGIDDMWQNLLVEKAYEPGSTIKVLTVAAAIEEGVFDPDSFYDSSPVTMGGSTIADYNGIGWGVITELEGLSQSSNTLMIHLVKEMGYDVWESYIREFGLLQETGSGFANEASGSMNYDYEADKVTTGFGQGIYVTPYQMMQAFTAIANDGNMMKLQLVNRYEEDGTMQVVEPEVVSSPISKETANKTLEYLQSVVYADTGTGAAYDLDDYTVSAKTGTAEVFNLETNTYEAGLTKYLYSVVGFVPSEDPQYVLYITAEQPKNLETTASDMMTKIYTPLLTRALEYNALGDSESVVTATVPDVSGLTVGEAQQNLSDASFVNVEVIGDGEKIVSQTPAVNEEVSVTQPIFLMSDDTNPTMPDFTGLNASASQALTSLLGIEVELEGEGVVVGQSIAVGEQVNNDKTIVLQLAES